MFNDDLEPQKKAPAQKNLENLGVAELEAYIVELRAEIERTEKEIIKKKAIRDRAAAAFKS
jgi:uncharacterized small protein (DUF1192 family)